MAGGICDGCGRPMGPSSVNLQEGPKEPVKTFHGAGCLMKYLERERKEEANAPANR